MELFTERLSTPQQTSQETKLCTSGDADLVRNSITEFHYNIDMKSTFPKTLCMLWRSLYCGFEGAGGWLER